MRCEAAAARAWLCCESLDAIGARDTRFEVCQSPQMGLRSQASREEISGMWISSRNVRFGQSKATCSGRRS
ncbi:unnamed protein product [Penicillium roqueforti FM164]|uniref:Genomic scaffold, ProqFM164S01 n=1 Tax=Penicillium roqueforti (strain FM164) TaxID=1365484 RepID=W6PRK0_PENRF|nr:unnamed protein product [Penicillium roqueforti FM164]